MNKKLTAKIKSLPQKPGAYIFKNAAGQILYIGKAINLRSRVRSHFERLSPAKKNAISQNSLIAGDRRETPNRKPLSPTVNIGLSGEGWPLKVTDIDFIITASEKKALLLENELIKKYSPKYNIQWRDDKSYFWVSFSNDEWPRVKIIHNPSLRAQRSNPEDSSNTAGSLASSSTSRSGPRAYGARDDNFIGPFVNGRELKQVLRALRKILPYRTCKNPYGKPCLQWHLGLCPAHGPSPVTNRQSSNPPQPSFKKEGGAVFLQKTARVDLKKYRESLDTLKQLIRLYAGEPIRTEAYDISNIQGTNATGSMIVFKGSKPDKAQYRKFRIKTVRNANDIAMLKEILRRRLNHAEWPLPDLILIDGGRAQLNAATLTALSYKLKAYVISLAKQEEELYTIYSNKVLRLSALPTDLRLLFQTIRDEAHRFAISYYRHLHAKKFKRRTASKKTRD